MKIAIIAALLLLAGCTGVHCDYDIVSQFPDCHRVPVDPPTSTTDSSTSTLPAEKK